MALNPSFAFRPERILSSLPPVPAGIAYKGSTFGESEARHTMDVNFAGTRAVCEQLLPLMGEGGRIVNVASRSGLQGQLGSQTLKSKFQVGHIGHCRRVSSMKAAVAFEGQCVSARI